MEIKEKKQKFRLLKFLSVLYGNCDQSGFLELRPMTYDYELDYEHRKWISLRNEKRFIEEAWKLRKRRHVFFGVGTRTKSGKKKQKGTKKFVKELPALFCDLDFEDFSGGKEEAEEFIDDFFVPASIRVFSGHGYHLYFLLETPFNIQEEETEKIEQILRAIQEIMFADTLPDLSRVLRLPYTSNIKNPSRPVLSKIEKIECTRYPLQDFEDQFWHILKQQQANQKSNRPAPERSIEKREGRIDIESLKVSDKIKTLIREGNSTEEYNYQSRSEADMAVITGLLASGYNPRQIKQIFEENPEGIGEKYQERGNAREKYLRHSINSARKFLSTAGKEQEVKNETD